MLAKATNENTLQNFYPESEQGVANRQGTTNKFSTLTCLWSSKYQAPDDITPVAMVIEHFSRVSGWHREPLGPPLAALMMMMTTVTTTIITINN